MSYHVITSHHTPSQSYDILSYDILSHHIIPPLNLMTSYLMTSYHITSYPLSILWHLILCHLITTHVMLCHHITSYPLSILWHLILCQVDKNLLFLESYVTDALANGAKPYSPPEHNVRALLCSSLVISDSQWKNIPLHVLSSFAFFTSYSLHIFLSFTSPLHILCTHFPFPFEI